MMVYPGTPHPRHRHRLPLLVVIPLAAATLAAPTQAQTKTFHLVR